mgnify:FL=1
MIYKLAKVSKASLEIQDRGILNFWIHVDYEEGCSQGVGGIVLDGYDKELKGRVGTAGGCEVIRQLLLLFQVNDFSEMKGKYIWVVGEGEGLSFNPKGLKALRVDKPGEVKEVIFKDIFDKFKEPKAQ